jgi:hypothetical protein
MNKKVLFILMATAFLWSCGSQTTTDQEQTETQEQEVIVEEPTVIALADFKDKAESLVGKEVILEGTVIHVCKHGGKKMFITADDPNIRIKITAGEENISFDTELEGSYVSVHGIVEAVEAEEVGEGQGQGQGKGDGTGEGERKNAGEGEHEHEGEHEEDEDHVNIYDKPQYSVFVIDYTVEEIIPE